MPAEPVEDDLKGVLLHLRASTSLIAERLRTTEAAHDRPAEDRPVPGRDGDRTAVAIHLHAERRRRRAKEGDHADLFGDPAWDILLDLYVQEASGREVSVSSACLASNVPATTALRWIGALERRGLMHRIRDQQDRRRTLVRLTARGADLVERMLPGDA